MNKSALKNYFKYIQDVLGITQVFNKKSLLMTPSHQLVIAILDLNNYSFAEKSLLDKMIVALNYDQQRIRVQDITADPGTFNFKLILTDEIGSHENFQENIVITYSPRRLLQEPALKKAAWAAMQMLMQKIKS